MNMTYSIKTLKHSKKIEEDLRKWKTTHTPEIAETAESIAQN